MCRGGSVPWEPTGSVPTGRPFLLFFVVGRGLCRIEGPLSLPLLELDRVISPSIRATRVQASATAVVVEGRHMTRRRRSFSSWPPKMESMPRRASAQMSSRERLKCSATRRYSLDRGLPKTPTSSVCLTTKFSQQSFSSSSPSERWYRPDERKHKKGAR